VISGATDPVGRHFSEELSKFGFNLVLVDSDDQALSDLKDKLESTG
jgi:short-subunit dehydrogenase